MASIFFTGGDFNLIPSPWRIPCPISALLSTAIAIVMKIFTRKVFACIILAMESQVYEHTVLKYF